MLWRASWRDVAWWPRLCRCASDALLKKMLPLGTAGGRWLGRSGLLETLPPM